MTPLINSKHMTLVNNYYAPKKKKKRFVTCWNLKDRFEYNVSTAKSWKYTTITFKRGNLDPRAQISSASVGSSACQHVVTAHRSLRSVGHTSKLAARVGPDNTLLGRATSEVKRQQCPSVSRLSSGAHFGLHVLERLIWRSPFFNDLYFFFHHNTLVS